MWSTCDHAPNIIFTFRKSVICFIYFRVSFGKLFGKGPVLLADTCNLLLVFYKIICVNMYHLVYLGIMETFRGPDTS